MKKIVLIYLLIFGSVFADSKMKVFGHLSQAYAISPDGQIFGIPTDGTSDYRNLALQFRFDMNEYNSFVIQLNHKRLGQFPTANSIENVELDWGFFERRFENGLNLRFGKVQMPLGIYNEFRDVGILLPFYRTPPAVYLESRASSEAINGATLSYEAPLKNDWSLSSELFVGQWDWEEWGAYINLFNSQKYDIVTQKVEIHGAIGGQFWLNTPIDGMRFGFSSYTGAQKNAFLFEAFSGVDDPRIYFTMLSFDSDFDRFAVKSEISRFDLGNSDASFIGGYVLGSIKITQKFLAHLQYDSMNLYNIVVEPAYQEILNTTGVDKKNVMQDFGISMNYHFNSSVVGKAEYHFIKSLLAEDRFNDPYLGELARTDYMIFSIATSF